MQLYVLAAQGFGDDEDAFETVGVYSSEENAKAAQQQITNDAEFTPVFCIECYTLDK
jgi:hypothetical protein